MDNCFWVAAHDDHGDDKDEGCAILYDGESTVDHDLEEFLLGVIINRHPFHEWHESKQGHWVSLFLEKGKNNVHLLFIKIVYCLCSTSSDQAKLGDGWG